MDYAFAGFFFNSGAQRESSDHFAVDHDMREGIINLSVTAFFPCLKI